MATRPNWVSEHKVKFIVQFGPEKVVKDVPMVDEFLRVDADRILLATATAPLMLGRPFLAPPGVPAERVEILRNAMMSTFADPDFLAEAERLKLGVNVPRSPAMIRDIVNRAYATPADVRQRLLAIARP